MDLKDVRKKPVDTNAPKALTVKNNNIKKTGNIKKVDNKKTPKKRQLPPLRYF